MTAAALPPSIVQCSIGGSDMYVRTFNPQPVRPLPLRPHLGLALQGGGAYGAFAWGGLDRLLDERRFKPVAISGASAGALNAAVLAAGLIQGGAKAAKTALAALWSAVAEMPFLKLMGSPGAHLQMDLLTRLVSPYQFNPHNINPLRDLLGGLIDFDALRAGKRVELFISATNVRSGDSRIFRDANCFYAFDINDLATSLGTVGTEIRHSFCRLAVHLAVYFVKMFPFCPFFDGWRTGQITLKKSYFNRIAINKVQKIVHLHQMPTIESRINR